MLPMKHPQDPDVSKVDPSLCPAGLPQDSGSMTWEVRGHWWGPGDVGQDGVQGPGKYFGLDPWGSVQEVARPSTSVSHPKGRPRQLPLETRGEPAGGSLLDQKGSAQASGSPGCGRGSGDSQGNPAALASTLTTTFSNHKHSLTFSRLQESGHPEEGAQWGAQRLGFEPGSRFKHQFC